MHINDKITYTKLTPSGLVGEHWHGTVAETTVGPFTGLKSAIVHYMIDADGEPVPYAVHVFAAEVDVNEPGDEPCEHCGAALMRNGVSGEYEWISPRQHREQVGE